MNIKKYRLEYSDNEIAIVKNEIEKTLKLGYLTDGGPNVEKFEKSWSKLINIKNSIAVSSCTAGLECILRAIDIENGSVIVPAYTFIASIMSIYNCRGIPIFADISKDTLSLSLESIKKSIRSDTKAVMVVHVGGVISNEIQSIRNYCNKNDLILIEDAACAHGASFNGISAGNFGHAACFSFHHSKVLTSGEGGIITTNDNKLAERIRRIRAIGLDRSINNWESFEVGSNAKMSEITAILALLHVENANKIYEERKKIAKMYDNLINFNKKIRQFKIPENTKSGYYKYFVRVADASVIEKFKAYASKKNIDLPPRAYSYTCDKQKLCKKMQCVMGDSLQNSYEMVDEHLCLPMYNGLSNDEINYIIDILNSFSSK